MWYVPLIQRTTSNQKFWPSKKKPNGIFGNHSQSHCVACDKNATSITLVSLCVCVCWFENAKLYLTAMASLLLWYNDEQHQSSQWRVKKMKTNNGAINKYENGRANSLNCTHQDFKHEIIDARLLEFTTKNPCSKNIPLFHSSHLIAHIFKIWHDLALEKPIIIGGISVPYGMIQLNSYRLLRTSQR